MTLAKKIAVAMVLAALIVPTISAVPALADSQTGITRAEQAQSAFGYKLAGRYCVRYKNGAVVCFG